MLLVVSSPAVRGSFAPSMFAQDRIVVLPRDLSRKERVLISETMSLSVVEETERTHLRHWAIWEAFVLRMGFDVYLRGHDYQGKLAAVCLAISTMLSEGESQTKIGAVVRSLKFHFDKYLIEGKEFLLDPALSRILKATRHRGRTAFNQRVRLDRQPVTWDMVAWIRLKHRTGLGAVEDAMVHLAVELAYNFMWRASEFIGNVTRKRDTAGHLREDLIMLGIHALRREDVRCLDINSNVLSVLDVASLIDSRRVHSVEFVITSSKADQHGVGRFVYLKREGLRQTELLENLLNFLQISGTHSEDLFMSRWRSGKNLKLNRRMVTKAIKAAAEAFGLPPGCFSIHCLRIGGATQMAAIEGESGMIERVAGWAPNRASASSLYKRSTSLDHGAIGSLDRAPGDKILDSSHLKSLRSRAGRGKSSGGVKRRV